MSSPAGTGTCPFTPLIERDLAGPTLDEHEQSTLEAHLAQGCSSCEQLLESHLSDESDEARALDETLTAAVDDAAASMAEGRAAVLARVEDELRRERDAQARRVRRRHLRALFYLTNVAALVLLLVAYVGTVVVVRLQRRAAQRLATETELQALVRALTRYVKDHDVLPPDARALVAELGRPSPAGSPYYRLDPERIVDGELLDDFGRPYRYLPGRDRALVYSVGPDGQDAEGQGDDIGAWVYFVHD